MYNIIQIFDVLVYIHIDESCDYRQKKSKLQMNALYTFMLYIIITYIIYTIYTKLKHVKQVHSKTDNMGMISNSGQ